MALIVPGCLLVVKARRAVTQPLCLAAHSTHGDQPVHAIIITGSTAS
jgi:hypothetical protein